MRLAIILATFCIGSGAVAAEPAAIDTQNYLTEFHQNPRAIMNARPPKRDESGQVMAEVYSPFSKEEIESNEYLEARDEIRMRICANAGKDCSGKPKDPRRHRFADVGERDRIEDFLYSQNIVRRLADMEKMGLTSAQLPTPPWSDSYWPIHKGMIARRFAAPGFPDSRTWINNYNYFLNTPPMSYVNSGSVSQLSPAEKYDYLVGDHGFRLTHAAWNKGKSYFDRYGRVPGWVGLCHGWSPASIMFKQPMKPIDVQAYNGRTVRFYPSDIKALASLLWGETPPIMKFAGSRCKKTNPVEDEIGRVVDDGCFNVNPGTWHMAIVNELGIQKRGFVMDSTYDFEVWNYPLHAYSYHYFNPQTLQTSKHMAGMAVPIEQYTIDKFKPYRSPLARHVLGVSMDVTYAIPTAPSRGPGRPSSFHTVRYVYDLEVDVNGNIIGGEWYSNFHPDFIWNPPPDGRALSRVEKAMAEPVTWDGEGPIPAALHEAALKSSPKNEPLAAVVERLVEMSLRE